MPDSNPLRSFGISDSTASILIPVIDVFIMFMPTIGYLDTVRIMISSKSSIAFPYNTCIILLLSHGLKTLYFIFHRYAVRIFGQSVTQIGAALLMAYVKFYYSGKPYKTRRRSSNSSFKDEIQNQKSNLMYFLNAKNAKNFFEFILSVSMYCILILFIFFFCYYVIGEKLTVDIIGILANLIESTVSIPIFIKIVINKDINNLSVLLILQFVLGDLMKLTLFILNKAPLSFIGGSILQMSLDLTLFAFFLKLYFCRKQNLSDGELLITTNNSNPKIDDEMSIESESEQLPTDFESKLA